MRMRLRVAMGLWALVATLPAAAQPMQMLPARNLAVELLALQLGLLPPAQPTDAESFRQRWVDDFAQQVARAAGDPEGAPRWSYATTAQSSPSEAHWLQEAPTRNLRPQGIEAVVLVADQNSLLVKGTPAAIDQLRELMAMLDQPAPMVNLEVRLVDAPTSKGREWGVDFVFPGGDGLVGSVGNLPASGVGASLQLGYRRVDVGLNESHSEGSTVSGANITTTSGFPAFISTGRMLPIFRPEVYHDDFGNRTVEWQTDAVFIGTELYVEPRVNRDGTITAYVEPTFVEAAGSVIGPNGVVLPITQTLGLGTQVTVQDGETIELGGFERSLREYNDRFRGLLSGREARVDSHPRLLLTARIVRQVPEIGEHP